MNIANLLIVLAGCVVFNGLINLCLDNPSFLYNAGFGIAWGIFTVWAGYPIFK